MNKSETRTGSPIFIVGYIHTGTSLLKEILEQDPSLFSSTGETHIFHQLEKIRREYPDLSRESVIREFVMYVLKVIYLGPRRANWMETGHTLADFGLTEAQFETIVDGVKGQRDHGRVFGMVFDYLTRFAGKERWFDKTPAHLYYLDQILAIWPDARVIEMVRDPRAALASKKSRRSEEWAAREKERGVYLGRDVAYDPLLDSISWRAAVHTGEDARRRYPDNILTVRYEDLVTYPVETMQRICDFTGLAYSPDMLNVRLVNSTTQTEGENGGITTAAVEKWRNKLSPEEVSLIQSVVGKEMKRLNYKPAAVSMGARAKTPVLVVTATPSNLMRTFRRHRQYGGEKHARGTLHRLYARVLRLGAEQK